MNYLSHAQVRKKLVREFGPALLAMLDAVAIEMSDEMAYSLALEIRSALALARSSASALVATDNGAKRNKLAPVQLRSMS